MKTCICSWHLFKVLLDFSLVDLATQLPVVTALVVCYLRIQQLQKYNGGETDVTVYSAAEQTHVVEQP